jgi:DNA polymerase-3 subunit epsilon
MLGDVPAAGAALSPRIALDGLDLRVIVASADELTAHDAVLSDLDRAVKGTSVWRTEPAVVENAEAAA